MTTTPTTLPDSRPARTLGSAADRPDLLNDPDPQRAAEAAAVENLLRCHVRETRLPAPRDGVLHVPLPATGTALLVPVHHWSPTGWHRFGPPRPAGTPEEAPPLDAVTLAALLTRETAAGGGGGRGPRGGGGGRPPPRPPPRPPRPPPPPPPPPP
ncbi:iron transporter, partial [Streptomyces sp. NPDC059374]